MRYTDVMKKEFWIGGAIVSALLVLLGLYLADNAIRKSSITADDAMRELVLDPDGIWVMGEWPSCLHKQSPIYDSKEILTEYDCEIAIEREGLAQGKSPDNVRRNLKLMKHTLQTTIVTTQYPISFFDFMSMPLLMNSVRLLTFFCVFSLVMIGITVKKTKA